MPGLRRMLRLFAVMVLVVTGTCAVVSGAAAGTLRDDGEPPWGFDQKMLIEVCDRYGGKYLEDLPKPYVYGCVFSDGEANCLETTECMFFRLTDRPPFEESCERVGGKFIFDKFDVFRCWNEREPVIVLECDPEWETCQFEHEPPMP